MSTKLIAYDLHFGTEKVYKMLIAAIETFTDNSLEIEKSVWLVASDDDCKNLRDVLEAYIDKDDKLFICPLPRGSVWSDGLKSLQIHQFMTENS